MAQLLPGSACTKVPGSGERTIKNVSDSAERHAGTGYVGSMYVTAAVQPVGGGLADVSDHSCRQCNSVHLCSDALNALTPLWKLLANA